jgi:hypothetical protein
MAGVSNLNWKKRGREKMNSRKVTIRVIQRRVSFFSLSTNRRMAAPSRGKKVIKVNRGNSVWLITQAPFESAVSN